MDSFPSEGCREGAQKHHPLYGVLVVPLGWEWGICCSHGAVLDSPLSHTSHGLAEVGKAETSPQLCIPTTHSCKGKLISWGFSFWDHQEAKASNEQDLVGSRGILEALDMAGI